MSVPPPGSSSTPGVPGVASAELSEAVPGALSGASPTWPAAAAAAAVTDALTRFAALRARDRFITALWESPVKRPQKHALMTARRRAKPRRKVSFLPVNFLPEVAKRRALFASTTSWRGSVKERHSLPERLSTSSSAVRERLSTSSCSSSCAMVARAS